MTRFVQIIEFTTSRIDQIRALVEQFQDAGSGGALRGTVTEDRERPGHYYNIVEFDSYEAAMSNSSRPEVSVMAAKMAELCDEPPRFYNLDVVEMWSAEGTSPSTKAAVVGAAAAVAGAAATGVTKARERLQERRAQQSARTATFPRTPSTVSPPATQTETDGPAGGAGTGSPPGSPTVS